ncbi:hypothetical protein BDR05DRAFT_895673, partial [Suillus weaverae]
ASSVDAERAFSGGRLQVNHLQHGINSQTFKAQVAVGSWYNTPSPAEVENLVVLFVGFALATLLYGLTFFREYLMPSH